MVYMIIYNREANNQLNQLGKTGKFIKKEISRYLSHQPDVESKKRKHLHPNAVAEWELRLGNWRVLYNIHADEVEVVIIAVGKKQREKLLIDGEEVTL